MPELRKVAYIFCSMSSTTLYYSSLPIDICPFACYWVFQCFSVSMFVGSLPIIWKQADAMLTHDVVSGQLLVLLRRLNSSTSLGLATAAVTKQRIGNIKDVAGYVSDVATPFIQLRQPDYFYGIHSALLSLVQCLPPPHLSRASICLLSVCLWQLTYVCTC